MTFAEFLELSRRNAFLATFHIFPRHFVFELVPYRISLQLLRFQSVQKKDYNNRNSMR